MIAIDTNVIVRLLARDDLDQWRRAHALVQRERILIATTVLLEAEWVLRRAYDYSAEQIADGFRSLISLPQVTLREPTVVDDALLGYEHGIDLADAIHIAAATPARRYATFDRSLIKASRSRPQRVEVVAP